MTDIHSRISGGKERLILGYEPSCRGERLAEEMERSRLKDLKTGMTSLGRTGMIFPFLSMIPISGNTDPRGSRGRRRFP